MPKRKQSPMPKKKARGAVDDPEESPHEPQGNVNKRELARQFGKGEKMNARTIRPGGHDR